MGTSCCARRRPLALLSSGGCWPPLVLRALVGLLLWSPASAAAASDEEFVQDLYRSLLCREGDLAGIVEKVGVLKAGTLTRAQMILLARFSTEYHTSKAYKTDPGSTTSECGACSSCKAAEATACCPGSVEVPEGYDETKPTAELASFFHYAADDSCSTW